MTAIALEQLDRHHNLANREFGFSNTIAKRVFVISRSSAARDCDMPSRRRVLAEIDVIGFPAFIVTDDKGNDFFAELNLGRAVGRQGITSAETPSSASRSLSTPSSVPASSRVDAESSAAVPMSAIQWLGDRLVARRDHRD